MGEGAVPNGLLACMANDLRILRHVCGQRNQPCPVRMTTDAWRTTCTAVYAKIGLFTP